MIIKERLIRAFGLLMLAFTLTFAMPPGRHDRGDEVKRVERAAEVFTEIMNAPDNSIPARLFEKAECVAIVPGLSKGGIAVGGDYGKGVVMCRRGEKDWAGPAFITVGGGSFGFQLGFEKVDLVALIMNRHGMEQLLQDKFTIGSDASAAAGPVGRTASAETDIKMDAEILTYSRSKGLFSGLALNGVVVKPDREGNRAFYRKDKDVDAREILEGAFPMPPDAAPLKTALSRTALPTKN